MLAGPGTSSAAPVEHRHEHAHTHTHAQPSTASVLSAGAAPRLAVAAGLVLLLWLAVWWALAA